MNHKDYRVEKDDNEVKHYYLRAEGQWVEVEKEVYLLYESDDKSEYRRRIEESEYEFLSIEKLMEDCDSDDSVSGYIPDALHSCSAEEVCFNYSDFSYDAEFLAWFRNEVRHMPVDRQAFLNLFERCNCSIRKVSKIVRIPKDTIGRFLKKLFHEMTKRYYNEVIG